MKTLKIWFSLVRRTYFVLNELITVIVIVMLRTLRYEFMMILTIFFLFIPKTCAHHNCPNNNNNNNKNSNWNERLAQQLNGPAERLALSRDKY